MNSTRIKSILQSLAAIIVIGAIAFLSMSPNAEVVKEDPYLFFTMILSVAIVLTTHYAYKTWLEPRITMIRLLHKTLSEENLDTTDAIKKYALGMEIDKKDE